MACNPYRKRQTPVYNISCFTGSHWDSEVHPEENITGVRDDWRGAEGFDWLLAQFDAGRALGARRFMLNRPGGSLRSEDEPYSSGNATVTAAQWWTIPQARRDRLRTHLGAYIAAHAIEVGVFIGSRCLTPYTTRTAPTDDDYPHGLTLLEPTTCHGLSALEECVMPWAQLGVTHFYLDILSNDANRDFAVPLNRWGNPRGIVFVGENIPTESLGGGQYRKRDGYCCDAPWIAQESFISFRYDGQAVDPNHQDQYVWLGTGETYADDAARVAKVEQRFGQGYTPITGNAVQFARAVELAAAVGQ